MWTEDIRSIEDLNWISQKFGTAFLPRSWYRWGLPPPEKDYEARKDFVSLALKQGFRIGGGGSLSVVNSRDLESPSFNKKCLAVDRKGVPIPEAGIALGTLSSPGFRTYLINEAMKQVGAGAKELHWGETNGAIFMKTHFSRESPNCLMS
jgi:hypothetical protein